MTFIARRRFMAEYADGDRVTIEAGERLSDDHQIARQHPSEFDHIDDEPRSDPQQNGRAQPTRSAPGGGSRRRRLTAEQQGAIRRARTRGAGAARS
jgi:hypothetical protein